MKSIYLEIATLLLELEGELRSIGEWQAEPPSAEALASTQPFCVDTLTLPQWLQFVFLPRMSHLIEFEQPLPAKCGVAPMAEEFFRGSDVPAQGLISKLHAIDERLEQGQ